MPLPTPRSWWPDRWEADTPTNADDRHCHLPFSSVTLVRESGAIVAPSFEDHLGAGRGRHRPADLRGPSHPLDSTTDDAICDPLQELLMDESISEILVTGPSSVLVERRGRIERARFAFADQDHLVRTIRKLARRAGVHLDADYPLVDARLPDGSRLSAMIPPLAVDGPVLSWRRGAIPCRPSELLAWGSVPREVLEFLEAAVVARVNLLIYGEAGSGKTTLLNALCRSIPHNERIVTIENGAELKLEQPQVIRLDALAPREGAIPLEDLVRQALRMNPDRVVLGEARGRESWEAWQAVAAGHGRLMMTIMARDPRQVVARMEAVVRSAGDPMPRRWIRRSLLAEGTLLIETSRTASGTRRVTRILELNGSRKRGRFRLRRLFACRPTTNASHPTELQPSGRIPRCLPLIHAAGITFPEEFFVRRER